MMKKSLLVLALASTIVASSTVAFGIDYEYSLNEDEIITNAPKKEENQFIKEITPRKSDENINGNQGNQNQVQPKVPHQGYPQTQEKVMEKTKVEEKKAETKEKAPEVKIEQKQQNLQEKTKVEEKKAETKEKASAQKGAEVKEKKFKFFFMKEKAIPENQEKENNKEHKSEEKEHDHHDHKDHHKNHDDHNEHKHHDHKDHKDDNDENCD